MPLFSQVKSGCQNVLTSRRKRRKSQRGQLNHFPSSKGDDHHQVIETPEGQLTITFTPKKRRELRPQATTSFWPWILSVEQANLILNHLPMEITFVNKDDIFQYYNDAAPFEEMVFKRTPSQVGRNVELCHPPKYLRRSKPSFRGFVKGKRQV